MDRKRITLICSSYPPETGAAPGRMYHLAQVLHANGYTVQVICAMPNYPTGKIFAPYKRKIRVKEVQDGIGIVRLWMVPTNSSGKIKRAFSTLSYCLSLFLLGLPLLLRRKPGIVLVSSPPFVTGYIGTLMARMVQATTVLNISDIWPQTAYELGFMKAGWLYHFLLKRESAMYRRAAAFTAQSEAIRDHLNVKAPGKPVFIYRNLQPAIPQAQQERPAGVRKIVYAGLLGIAQGVLNIIRNVDCSTCGTELHIYGQGNELQQIKAFIAAHPEKKIYYHGSFPASDMPGILSRYHIMLVPLSTEIAGAVPSKIFVAVANGIPLLFCGGGEGALLVERHGIGMNSTPGDYETLAINMTQMAGMAPEQYELMRSACIRCSESVFNTAAQDKAFVSFLEGL